MLMTGSVSSTKPNAIKSAFARMHSLTAERIVTALAEAELIELMMSDGQATYANVRTEGDFERISKAVGLKCLPRRLL